jgi:hypothetical protein
MANGGQGTLIVVLSLIAQGLRHGGQQLRRDTACISQAAQRLGGSVAIHVFKQPLNVRPIPIGLVKPGTGCHVGARRGDRLVLLPGFSPGGRALRCEVEGGNKHKVLASWLRTAEESQPAE